MSGNKVSRCSEENNEKLPTAASSANTATPLAQSRQELIYPDLRPPVRAEKLPAPEDGPRGITEDDCAGELGYSFSARKKYAILAVVFFVQVSMNLNTALYSNGQRGMSEEFGIPVSDTVWGAAIFLIAYAFGCELWAPWSEEVGRKWVLQASLCLVNVFGFVVAMAPNFHAVLAGRFLGGLSTAGGSVTLGMVADMFESDAQGHAVAFVVFSSVGGSILGPIVGGFIEEYLYWRWATWIQVIFGGAVQLLHIVAVPETRTTCMMDSIAEKRRENGVPGYENTYGPNELVPFRERFHYKELIETWKRPFLMFITEPIVLVLSLLSGFADALIFMQIQSFGLVYRQWGFGSVQIGLAFLSIGIGYVLAWLSFIPAINRNKRQRLARPSFEKAQYESRLWWLLYTAPCLPIGLLIFAFTANGPPIHWAFSMFGALVIGIANYAIYMATIDYMVAAYGPYAASATGGNGWARDILAGILTPAAIPFYTKMGPPNNLRNASLVLFGISIVLVGFVFWVYYSGPALRKKSSFAQNLANAEGAQDEIVMDGTDGA
ncbi:MFS multidrug transporter [Thozetella sp. PMI_491]|nr:MFS multidrug transporter [Thozetella sp. PMI_491]